MFPILGGLVMRKKSPAQELNNLQLFEFCMNRQELLADPHFSEQNPFIITQSRKETNDLLDAYQNLHEFIICYKNALKDKDTEGQSRFIAKIIELMKIENMNYAEFPCFWNVLDVSHSLFIKEMSDAERVEFVKQALDLYLQKRYPAYASHGLSPSILQANCDSYAHKRNSNFAKNKLTLLLSNAGLTHYDKVLSGREDNTAYFQRFRGDKAAYRVISSKNEVFFEGYLKYINENYEFLAGRKNKAPDFIINIGDQTYIVEHKHVKEGGGGQDKQIDELIEFITMQPSSDKVHYVSYLDGYYFNIMRKYLIQFQPQKGKKTPKPISQINSIRNALNRISSNYFINTAGLKELITMKDRLSSNLSG